MCIAGSAFPQEKVPLTFSLGRTCEVLALLVLNLSLVSKHLTYLRVETNLRKVPQSNVVS